MNKVLSILFVTGVLVVAGGTILIAANEPGVSTPTPEATKAADGAAKAALEKAVAPKPKVAAFASPPDSAIPNDAFGDTVRLGQAIFRDPSAHAGQYVGNTLKCSNCHLDSGRLADSAPMGPAYVEYPAYRAKNGHVNTFEERFRFSMNGKAPPLGDKVLVALETYSYFLAKGAPTGEKLPGRGYPKLPKPAQGMDYTRGATVFGEKCALCHGADGLGQKANGETVFPSLWGADSFNWGAGMGSVKNAAGFIKANMPLSQGGTLTDQEAWDVALFMDSHERPQDPRFLGTVEATRAKFHDSEMSMYGRTVNGVLLGQNSPPSGPRANVAPGGFLPAAEK
jgi:thiosulfate dehydrogenase